MRYTARKTFWTCGVFAVVFILAFLAACAKDGSTIFTPGNNSIQQEEIGETGLIHSEDDYLNDAVYWVAAPIQTQIPANWDLRDKSPVAIPPPRNQNCGDCWAWATHHGMEIWYAVNKGKLFDFSVQSVLSCSKAGSCGGGYMSAVTFLQKSGLPLEADFPYVGRDAKCKYSADELAKGFGNQIIEAPYVGESFEKSRYWKLSGQVFQSRDKIQQIQQAQILLNSPAILTVAAYGSSSDAVVTQCKSLNSGGNHMVTNIGWDNEGGSVNAHNYNSWGTAHGKSGISRLKWDCDGKLNRGYGLSTRVIRGDIKPPCDPPQNPNLQKEHVIFLGNKVELGKPMSNVKCVWSPIQGLKDPNSCVTDAAPEKSTEYHLEVSNDCGKVTAMTFVKVYAPVLTGKETHFMPTETILTPFGEVATHGE